MKGIGKTIKRRRKEGKTDYKARMNLLRGKESTRLVVRKSNRYIIAQFVVSDTAQDSVICGAMSKELLSHGWPESLEGSLKGLVAAYLTGRLLAKKAIKEGIKKAILDIGMHRNAKGGRMYAVLKGAVDAGIDIPHSKDALPTEKRLEENQKTREILNKLKEKIK